MALGALCGTSIFAQNVLILQPDELEGKDAILINEVLSNNNYANHQEFSALYWTVNSVWTNVRSLIAFDLSQLPQNAFIDQAKLSLWSATITGNHPQLHFGNNASYLRRVTSAWQENTVTWNNQPNTTEENQIILPTSSTSTQDYLEIDVTQLFQDIQNSGDNFGLMIQLIDDISYSSMVFASSDYVDRLKRPKLEIYYSIVTRLDKAEHELNEIRVFPNPTNDDIFLAVPVSFVNSGHVVNLFDVTGKEVNITTTLESEQIIKVNTAELQAGLYTIQVSNGEINLFRKVLIH